jgi:hypothetical protein
MNLRILAATALLTIASSSQAALTYGSNLVVNGGAEAGIAGWTVGHQTLDLGSTTDRDLAYSLSGWLGGWADQDDNALFYVQFLDEFNNEIGNATIGPVMARDRANQTGLQYRESDGLMPTGTRTLSFWLSMERLVAGDNDGYADNLAFIVRPPENTDVPEPGVASTFLLGLGLLGWARRRKVRQPPAC